MFPSAKAAGDVGRHRYVPGPPGFPPLALWGRGETWTYRVLPGARCTLWLRVEGEGGHAAFTFERDAYPNVLGNLLAASPSPGAKAASRRLRAMTGGTVATARASRAMVRFTRADALAFAGPGGEALADRMAAARALPLRNEPHPDAAEETMAPVMSPTWTYGSLDPVEIGRRARTPTGRWPASDARAARIMRGPRRIEDLDLLVALCSLPEDWVPADDAAWDAFASIVSATAPLALLLGHFDFLAPSRGRWEEYLAAQGGPEALVAAVADALDMALALARQVVVPALFRAGLCGDRASGRVDGPATAVALMLVAPDKGLGAILGLSRGWHARREAVEALAESPADDTEDERWPVPFPPQTAPNGILLTCLGSASRLRDEGDPDVGLGHCVGGYVDACATGRSVIVSLSVPGSPRALSTLELVRRGKSLRLRQHRGIRNGSPPHEAEAAAGWLLDRLADGTLAPSKAFGAHAWRERLGSRPYDLRSDRAFARAASAWAPFLPRPLRTADAVARACVAAADDLVRKRPGIGGHPLLAPFGLLPETGLCLYPSPLRGDTLTLVRLGNAESLRTALAVVGRRLPPGLRDEVEPYVVVVGVCLALILAGILTFTLSSLAGLPGWVSFPLCAAVPILSCLALVDGRGGEGRRRAWRRRVARALPRA